jgi:hypothetical protein
MDWTQVEERLVEDDRNKWDRKAASAELRISTSYVKHIPFDWKGLVE